MSFLSSIDSISLFVMLILFLVSVLNIFVIELFTTCLKTITMSVMMLLNITVTLHYLIILRMGARNAGIPSWL